MTPKPPRPSSESRGGAAWSARRGDRLVETGHTGIDEGLGRLAAGLSRLAGADLDDLCDALVDRVAGGRADDDLALLAV